MARTTLTRTTPLGPYPSLPVSADALDLTLTAADTGNSNQFLLDGPMLLIAQNTDAGSARTITLTSVADPQLRTGDITTYSIGIGETAVFKIDRMEGWRQSDGYFYLAASNAAVKFGIVRLG